MRVKFVRDYEAKGEQSYLKDAVADLDEGVAAVLLDLGVVKEFPRTAAELAEAATKYYPGDENRTAKQKAERAAQVVPLTGDTRSDTEDATGKDDPHVLRADLEAAAEKAAAKKANEAAAAEKAADEAAERQRAADKKVAEAKPSGTHRG